MFDIKNLSKECELPHPLNKNEPQNLPINEQINPEYVNTQMQQMNEIENISCPPKFMNYDKKYNVVIVPDDQKTKPSIYGEQKTIYPVFEEKVKCDKVTDNIMIKLAGLSLKDLANNNKKAVIVMKKDKFIPEGRTMISLQPIITCYQNTCPLGDVCVKISGIKHTEISNTTPDKYPTFIIPETHVPVHHDFPLTQLKDWQSIKDDCQVIYSVPKDTFQTKIKEANEKKVPSVIIQPSEPIHNYLKYFSNNSQTIQEAVLDPSVFASEVLPVEKKMFALIEVDFNKKRTEHPVQDDIIVEFYPDAFEWNDPKIHNFLKKKYGDLHEQMLETSFEVFVKIKIIHQLI